MSNIGTFEIKTIGSSWASNVPTTTTEAESSNFGISFIQITPGSKGSEGTSSTLPFTNKIFNYGNINAGPSFQLYENALVGNSTLKNEITYNTTNIISFVTEDLESVITFRNATTGSPQTQFPGLSWFICGENQTTDLRESIGFGDNNDISYYKNFDCPSYISMKNIPASGTSVHFVYAYFANMCFGPDTPIPTPTGDVLIKDLQVKDTIVTKHGPQQLAAIKSAHTYGLKYVKFSEGCLGEGLPKEDTWISKNHWMSLGYHDNQFFNQGNHSEEQDEKVFLTTHASTFINVIPGITYEDYPYAKEYNLVFDNWTSVDVNGMEATTHHPRNYYDGLHKSEYIDESKWKDNKIHHHDIAVPMNSHITWEEIVKHKPEVMPLKTFVRKILLWDDKEKLIISPKL